jgi:hypothetical protein
VTGRCYAADYTVPTPSALATAILDGEAAYLDAAGRPNEAAARINFETGLLTGKTLTPGVYTWTTGVSFDGEGTSVTFSGSPTDVFILQVSGNVKAGSGARVLLSGGALASNIFWQVSGFVEAGASAHLEGIFLVKAHAVFKTSSSLKGRMIAQTAVTLDKATITQP